MICHFTFLNVFKNIYILKILIDIPLLPLCFLSFSSQDDEVRYLFFHLFCCIFHSSSFPLVDYKPQKQFFSSIRSICLLGRFLRHFVLVFSSCHRVGHVLKLKLYFLDCLLFCSNTINAKVFSFILCMIMIDIWQQHKKPIIKV